MEYRKPHSDKIKAKKAAMEEFRKRSDFEGVSIEFSEHENPDHSTILSQLCSYFRLEGPIPTIAEINPMGQEALF